MGRPRITVFRYILVKNVKIKQETTTEFDEILLIGYYFIVIVEKIINISDYIHKKHCLNYEYSIIKLKLKLRKISK